MPQRAPYGTWRSWLTAARVAEGGLRLSEVALDCDDVYWLEGRPHERGRNVLVRRAPDGGMADVTPPSFNVRTRVNEYGGGAYLVDDGVAYCVNFADQRIYRIDSRRERGAMDLSGSRPAPEPLTPPGAYRYADLALDRVRRRLIAVREDHGGSGEPKHTLVAISLQSPGDAGTVLVSGADFYSTPRLSPDGSTLAWLSWRHPSMPWDGTELWRAAVEESGALSAPQRVAGGSAESVYQPGWSLDGSLHYASDRTGYWQLYRSTGCSGVDGDPGVIDDVRVRDAEFGRPQWVLGTSTWVNVDVSRLVVSYTRGGVWHLATLDRATRSLEDLAATLQPSEWMAANGTHLVLVAASSTSSPAVVRIDLGSGDIETIRAASSATIHADDVSRPESIEFVTSEGHFAHAFFYPPRNKDFEAPGDERPPLMVTCHGGPTGAARSTLDLHVQYWTSRGFALVDVNYGGSTGFGRAYRERLRGQWGVVDVDDVVAAARCLVTSGRVDGNRLVIRGGSAGGYTALAALAFRQGVFKAGASYYGISDLEALELDTHKFESRYSNGLIGPYPEARSIYRSRSPIHALDTLTCPLIVLQGLDDKIVPPNQSELLVDAVRAKGLKVAYLAFEGEQHGFRKADTIIRSLEAELYFYGKVFGFDPADTVPDVPIDNL